MYRPTPHFITALIALVALATFGTLASAADATVTGVNATQNTDGSAIPTDGSQNSLRDVRIQYGVCNAAGSGFASGSAIVTVPLMPADAGQPFSRVITGLTNVRQCFRARHSNIGDNFSDYSPFVVRDFTPPLRKPGSPTGITVAGLQEDLMVSSRWVAAAYRPMRFDFTGG